MREDWRCRDVVANLINLLQEKKVVSEKERKELFKEGTHEKTMKLIEEFVNTGHGDVLLKTIKNFTADIKEEE